MRPRRRRSRSWTIEPAGDGLVNVLRHGRPLRANLSPEQAVKYVREHRAEGDKVIREAPDGYRTDITRQV